MILLNLLLICLITPIIGQAQIKEKELKIEYDYYSGAQNTLHFEKRIELRATKYNSVSKYIAKLNSVNIRKPDEVEEKEINNYIFKDYKTNDLVYLEKFMGEIYVHEPLQQFNWIVTNSKDTILGYECRQAKTFYRGRNYIAYFTIDLPFKAAPWKFHGLPGVMLKVYSIDGFVNAEATTLKIKPANEPIINHFKNEKPISYDEFTELYKKKSKELKERIKAMSAQRGKPVTIVNPPRIEVIEEDN